MLVLSLWFSALLAGLDGLILAAFAQMKLVSNLRSCRDP